MPVPSQLEVNLLFLKVHIETDDCEVQARADISPLVVQLSKVQTVGDCLMDICASWQLPIDKVRLWDYENSLRQRVLGDTETLASIPLHMGHDVLLEHQKLDGSWHFLDDGTESGVSMDLFDGAGVTTSTSSTLSTGSVLGSSRTGAAYQAGGSIRQDAVVDSLTPTMRGVVGLSNL